MLREVAEGRRAGWLRIAGRTASAICAVLLVIFSSRAMLLQWGARQRQLAALVQQERTYEALRPEVRNLLKRQARLEGRVGQLEDLIQGRNMVAMAIQRAVEALPDELWLTKLDLSKGDRIEGVIEGYTTSFQSVTRFMEQLKTSAGWAVVKPLTTSVTNDPTSKTERVTFAIQVQQPIAKPRHTAPEPSEAKEE